MYNIPRYQASGSARLQTFAFFAMGLLLAVPVAWLYQMLTTWIPFIQLNVITVAAFGGAVGFAALTMILRGHCRSRLLAYGLTCGLAIGALAASWYWAYHHFLSDVAEAHPDATAEGFRTALPFSKFVEARVERGWSISNHGSSGSSMNGFFVYLIWLTEAGIVLGCAFLVARTAAERAYCERCEQWCDERGLRVLHVSRADIEPYLSSGDVQAIVNAMPPAEPKDRALALVLQAELCPKCDATSYVSLIESRTTIVKDKANEKKKTIIRQIVMLGPARAALLARLGGAVPELRTAPDA